jgi:hypothetical protein
MGFEKSRISLSGDEYVFALYALVAYVEWEAAFMSGTLVIGRSFVDVCTSPVWAWLSYCLGSAAGSTPSIN